MARITINDERVQLEENEDNTQRGLHVVVINPANGKIDKAKIFDTYTTSIHFDAFTRLDFPDGHIVVVACKDDCVSNLSILGKQWFEKMGSTQI